MATRGCSGGGRVQGAASPRVRRSALTSCSVRVSVCQCCVFIELCVPKCDVLYRKLQLYSVF